MLLHGQATGDASPLTPPGGKKPNWNGQKNGCKASQVLTMAQIDMDQQKRRGTSDRPVPLCGIVIRGLAAARGR
jgi:hypothetical protein